MDLLKLRRFLCGSVYGHISIFTNLQNNFAYPNPTLHFTLSHTIPTFNDPEKRSLLKT